MGKELWKDQKGRFRGLKCPFREVASSM